MNITARLHLTLSIVNLQLLFMKKELIFLLLALTVSNYFLGAQNIGIGTTIPLSRLHVEQGNVLFNGPAVLPPIPAPLLVSGTGARLMWYPDKAAFRVGYVSFNSWDSSLIGRYSFAAGKDVTAQGSGSVALGLSSNAGGQVSIAIGSNCFASDSSIALGKSAQSFGTKAVAIGNAAFSGSSNGFAIGNSANVPFAGTYGFAIGNNVTASGPYSLAMGNNSSASGQYSVAIGTNLTASGQDAIAFGRNSQAIGNFSTSFGLSSIASGTYSTAFGVGTSASEPYTTAFGRDNTASGFAATAFGNNSIASGGNSLAMGYAVSATGGNSVSLGSYASTSGYAGAFALGDFSTTTVMNSFVANGFRARFAGGYRLFTNSAVSIGAFLNANSNSWAALSDVRMKENFLPVNGENFLQKIAAMPQYTWNYIGQDAGTLRHYGPMAQDFYKAFGRDDLGEIGCDTLINQQDFLGVSFIAIQALEKRSAEQAKENDLLKNKLLLMEEANKDLAGKLVLLNENMDATLKLVKELMANK